MSSLHGKQSMWSHILKVLVLVFVTQSWPLARINMPPTVPLGVGGDLQTARESAVELLTVDAANPADMRGTKKAARKAPPKASTNRGVNMS